jgi:hypothetical protein
VLGGGFSGPPRAAAGVVPGQLQLAVAVRGPHHRDLAPDAVESDGAVRNEAFDLSLAFQFHAELGEERDGGVQVVDDDGDVVHPLNGHVSEHMTAASRQCGAEGPGGSVGLEVLPFDSVTLSDGHDPGERAPTRLHLQMGGGRAGRDGAGLLIGSRLRVDRPRLIHPAGPNDGA